MNIFITDSDASIAASNLCDAHIRKMILESVQLLSTWVRAKYPEHLEYFDELGIYKSSHFLHPSNIWIRESYENVCWLIEHTNAIYNIGSEFLWKKEEHRSINVLRKIEDFIVEVGESNVYSRHAVDYLTSPLLAMYDHIKPNYGYIAQPAIYGSRGGLKRKAIYRANSMDFAVEAYRYYICLKVFKDGSRPYWSYQDKPEWYVEKEYHE